MEKYRAKATKLAEAIVAPEASSNHQDAINILLGSGPRIRPLQAVNPVKKEWGLYNSSGTDYSMDMITHWQVCMNIFVNYKRINAKFIKQHKHDQFPIMYAMSLDYIPIQASSVLCERVFSSLKETTIA